MHKLFLPLSHPAQGSLSEKIVHLWEVPLHEPYQEQDYQVLSQEEKEKANRFIYEHHRNRFILSRARLKQLLGHYTHQEAKNISLTTLPHGKPILRDQTLPLEFNVTHSKTLALIAFGQTYPLGIDIEFFSERPYQGIAKHVFSPKEIAQLEKCPEFIRPLYFFKTWTQKEAVIKAIGLGFSYPTSRLETAFSESSGILHDPVYDTDWNVFTFFPKIACCGALSIHPSIQTIYYGQYPYANSSSF